MSPVGVDRPRAPSADRFGPTAAIVSSSMRMSARGSSPRLGVLGQDDAALDEHPVGHRSLPPVRLRSDRRRSLASASRGRAPPHGRSVVAGPSLTQVARRPPRSRARRRPRVGGPMTVEVDARLRHRRSRRPSASSAISRRSFAASRARTPPASCRARGRRPACSRRTARRRRSRRGRRRRAPGRCRPRSARTRPSATASLSPKITRVDGELHRRAGPERAEVEDRRRERARGPAGRARGRPPRRRP